MSANTSTRHEIKPAIRFERRRLLELGATNQREARIVKLEDGTGYAVGVHANVGKPWRIVIVSNAAKTIGGATKLFKMKLRGRVPPVRVFDPAKLDA